MEVISMELIRLEKTKPHITVQEGYNKFIRMKKASNLAPDTIHYYEIGYKYFSRFIEVSSPCSCTSIDTYYEYIEHLQKTRNANSY